MVIETLTIHVKEGFADQVVERFGRKGPVEEAPGFVDLSVLVKKARWGEEEVVVLIRWESEKHWKEWERSEPHLEGHRRERERGKPDFVLSSKSSVYDVKAVKTPS
ncbi:antibiotic biosynthesis monooxygenase [Paenibacillus flagellatus]|uniref:Antibiotic biosynthesis monooxygenase n=1 Tax=Paenibacillus flagellatus TaxID=2211139 RepID=A0A2V5KTG9_9BACL|nr:antibiotic biosynthesis monooxygenase [Paenibacillus flagellatus]PYI52506.1 antibiotic biosynthesis monooxygenase [Paenibacillus flagellatus]